MLQKNGHYILTLDNWNTICKHFNINPKNVILAEYPSLQFTEFALIDIYTSNNLLSFYNHDGMIRIARYKTTSGTNSRYLSSPYEIPISKILGKNPEAPDQDVLNIIKSRMRKTPDVAKKVVDKATEVVKSVTNSANRSNRSTKK